MADAHPQKKRKLESTKNHTSVDQFLQSLQSQNPDGAVEVLNGLRHQLAIRSDEGAIAPQDERLSFVQQWLERDPGAQDIFSLWEKANPRQLNLPVVIVSVLAALLTLLSSHYTNHALGSPIIKVLLSSQWMRRLNLYVGSTHNELVLVTLKLLGVISAFAGGREKKVLLDAFQWETKSLPKLLTLRRKGKVNYDPLMRPDIRTLYVLFLLSFLDAPIQTKSTFLEQHHDAFVAIFKGLYQDHYIFIRHVLEVLWTNLWSDSKLKRTTKIGIFNETAISHLLKIYERKNPDNEDPEQVSADLVHHFLLVICTRPGSGICFRDRGWYAREDMGEERGGKIYNKILANILKMLKVNEDSRQQELARRIFEACPELVAGYWSSAQLTLEPRLSTKWIANIAFFGAITSLPVPETTFFLPNTTLFNPIPPPLQIIFSNILPSEISPKNVFTKGLLSASGLVQHCAALTLAKCLLKYAKVQENFVAIEGALGLADTGGGEWGRRRKELEREMRRRVPEFQVILGFSQQQKYMLSPTPDVDQGGNTDAQQQPNLIKNALLQESSQRLLLLYHKYLPEIVVEARFDVGKTLASLSIPAVDEGEASISDGARGFQLVQHLHILQTLKESDQFVWINKSSSSRTNLYTLLKLYSTATIPALQSTLLDLLSHLLSNSILFQEASVEPRIWLISLPRLLRAPNARSPDNAELTDEGESVILFLDDCIQRCLKTPFRYIEETRALLVTDRVDTEDAGMYPSPSPLVTTLVEQLDAKIEGELLTPSDVLAIVSFVRKLVFRLSGQTPGLKFLERLVGRIDRVLAVGRLWSEKYPLMTAAVRKEVDALNVIIKHTEASALMVLGEGVLGYADEVATLSDGHNRALIAHSIIDRLRFMAQPVPTAVAKRMILAVQTQHVPALREFAQYLFPQSGHLWGNRIIVGVDVGEIIPAEWLLYNVTKEQILDAGYRREFIATFFSIRVTLQSCLDLFGHIDHKLDVVDDEEAQGFLSLLAILTSEARSHVREADMGTLKATLFTPLSVVRRLAVRRDISHKALSGLREVLQSSFDPRSTGDRQILSEVSAHWLAVLQSCSAPQDYDKLGSAVLWIKYLPPGEILRLFDHLMSGSNSLWNSHSIPLLQSILPVIQLLVENDPATENALRERIPQLLTLREILFGEQVVEVLLSLAIKSTLPVGHFPGRYELEYRELGSFTDLIKRSESCWANRLQSFNQPISLHDFLVSDIWTTPTISIISSLLYRRGLPLHDFETWLRSEHASSRSLEHLSAILHTALDVYHCISSPESTLDSSTWYPHLSKMTAVCFDCGAEESSRQNASACVILALDIFEKSRYDLARLLTQSVESHHNSRPTLESLRIGFERLTPDLSLILLEWSLYWITGQLAKDTPLSREDLQVIKCIKTLTETSPIIKAQQVETLLGVVIQHHLSNATVVDLVKQCISKTHLKPIIVNRYIQNLLHHPQFHKLAIGGSTELNTRSQIVELLYSLFNLHPTNTCQITYVEPLLRIYHGTLSEEDLTLFLIFQLFEIHRKTSLRPLFTYWSPSSDITSSSPQECIQSLDPTVVLRTTLHFPQWRRLRAGPPNRPTRHSAHLYDPIFLVLLLHMALSENRPSTPYEWIELFRTNVVGLCIRFISSKEAALREFGLSQTAQLYQCLGGVEFQEKAHVMHILRLLKGTLATEMDKIPPRLPSYTTLILAHALHGIFYPSTFTFPLTARFLLQRPELDITDVPMLYSMLYNSSDDWKRERSWVIRYLATGMESSEDWKVLRHRHTWDLLASLFQSSEAGSPLRRGIFEVIANLTCNPHAAMAIILKSSFLAWLEMQISRAHGVESIKWTNILGNIVITVDHKKLDSALQSGWRTNICRCLSILLKRSRRDILLPAVHIIFKIYPPSHKPPSELDGTIKLAVEALRDYEAHFTIASGSIFEKDDIPLTYDLCPGPAINETLDVPLSHRVWARCVLLLWRTTMCFGHKHPSWDSLTCRLLISRYYDDQSRPEVEWARKEVARFY